MNKLFEDFSKELFASYKNEKKLIFPKYSDNSKIRVSEQEARFAFCAVLEKTENEFLYSVETPTQKKYSFSGGGEQSAMTDLTLYNKDKEIFANIEFKAHSVDIKNIRKDFEKLLREKVDCGIFVQVFENADDRTIENFFENKLEPSIKHVLNNFKTHEKKIVLYICCLKKDTKHWYEFQSIENLRNCLDKKEKFKKELIPCKTS